MLEEIRNRFLNNYYKDNVFTEEEKYYIQIEPELQELLKKSFLEGNVKDNFGCFESIISDEYYNSLSEEEQDIFLKRLIVNYINLDSFDIVEISDALNYYEPTDDKAEEIISFVNKYLDDNKDKIKVMVDDDTIDYLLNNKKYDIVYNISNIEHNSLSSDMRERIVKEFNDLGLVKPPYIISEEDIEKLSLKGLCDYCYNEGILQDEDFKNPSELLLKIKQRIIDLVQNDNDFKYMNMPVNDRYASSLTNYISGTGIYSFFTKEEQLEAYKKGLYFMSVGMLIDSKLSIDEFSDILINNISKSNNPYYYINEFLYSLASIRSINVTDEVIEHIYNKIIDNGYGVSLINKKISNEQKEKIIEKIKDGTNKINSISELYNSVLSDKELVDALIENVKIGSIGKDNSVSHNRKDSLIKKGNEEIYNESLSKILLNNPDIKLNNIAIFNKDIFDKLIKEKNYNCIVESIGNMRQVSGFTEDLYKWLGDNKDNLFLFHEILIGYGYNEELFLNSPMNPAIIEEIILYLVHNDYEEGITHEFYEKNKEAISRKYNLDLSKMDIIENNLGPRLLLYLNDNNIKKLLNQSIDKIEKIVSIFPKVDYNLVDVEALYESIIQYSYGKIDDNLEMINIFPNLLHALNDKNEMLVNKYIYMLVVRVEQEDLDKIKEKYGINDSSSPLEFLNNLINNLDGNNINILHDITNYSISQDRKFFRNNHYYEELDSFSLNNVYNSLYKTFFTYHYISKEDVLKIANKFGFKSIDELKLFAFNELDNKNDDEKYYYIIDNMLRIYTNKAREKRPIGYTIFDELDMPFDFEEKRLKNELENYYIPNMISNELFINELKDNGIDYENAKMISDGIKLDLISRLSEEEKKKIKLFKKIGLKYVRKDMDEEKIKDTSRTISILNGHNKLIKLFRPSNRKDAYQILSNLELNLLEKNVFCDEETTNLLNEIMKSKKMHLMEPSIYNLIKKYKLSLTENNSQISGFINYFKVILDNAKKEIISKNDNRDITTDQLLTYFSPSQILSLSNVYSSMSSIYSDILGVEDTGFIKSNPGRNSAKGMTSSERLKIATEDIVKLYNKQEITIPSSDDVVSLHNGKELEVIVGNFTSTCNLTHGERTDACMRIGGAGELLYNFCINNKKGFHIRFENPKTHEYISRVSGFRNGNTVYLNQLRNSLSNDYTDEDLIEATKIISKSLIEKTKDTSSPIENVFVSDGYATDNNVDLIRTRLNKYDVTKGLGKIYTDYTYNDACLIASKDPNWYVKLNPNMKEETYQTERSKPVVFSDNFNGAPEKINKVHTIKQLIDGKNVEEDEIDVLDFKDGISFCITNDEWYLYLNNNSELFGECIDIDPRAKEEFDKYKKVVMDRLDNYSKKENGHGYI